MSADIDTLDRKVLKLIAAFDRMTNPTTLLKKEHRGVFDLMSSQDDILDARERLQLWSENLGATRHEDDPRSLLHRLRDAPSVRRRIVEILEELEDLTTKLSHPDSSQTLPSDATGSDGESDDDLLVELRQVSTSTDMRSTWLLRSICDGVTRLFNISRLLSKSTATDRFARAQARQGPRFDDSYDISRLRERFKDTSGDDWLIHRLGKANAARRDYFKYCREHLERVRHSSIRSPTRTRESSGPNILQHLDRPHSQAPKTIVGTIGAASESLTKAFTVAPGLEEEVDDAFDDVDISSRASSFRGEESCEVLHFPPLTLFASPRTYFECPYCYETQRFNGEAGFRKHIQKDLRPFICTFPDCGMLVFDDRQAWIDHEIKEHRRRWVCPQASCKGTDFAGRNDLSDHLHSRHTKIYTAEHIDLVLRTSSRPFEEIEARACPLCDWDLLLRPRNAHVPADIPITVPINRFMKHLGHHLEQVALFALPRPMPDDQSSMHIDIHDDDLDDLNTIGSEQHIFESLPEMAIIVWTVVFARRWRIRSQSTTALKPTMTKDKMSTKLSANADHAPPVLPLNHQAAEVTGISPWPSEAHTPVMASSLVSDVNRDFSVTPDVEFSDEDRYFCEDCGTITLNWWNCVTDGHVLPELCRFNTQDPITAHDIQHIQTLDHRNAYTKINDDQKETLKLFRRRCERDGRAPSQVDVEAIQKLEPDLEPWLILSWLESSVILNPSLQSRQLDNPEGENIGRTGISRSTSGDSSINFIDKIKNRFGSGPGTFNQFDQFVEIMQSYQRGSKTIATVYDEVQVLLRSAPDLLEDFYRFLPNTVTTTEARQEAVTEPYANAPSLSVEWGRSDGVEDRGSDMPSQGTASGSDAGNDLADEILCCLCQEFGSGDMVKCDNDRCPDPWFHYRCVGLSEEPHERWVCSVCKGTAKYKDTSSSVSQAADSAKERESEAMELAKYGTKNRDGSWSCSYSGCTSSVRFQRGCDLRKHYKRHTATRLFCRHTGCPESIGAGFSSKKDLARHETQHNPGIECEWDGCDRVFRRRDKMRDHMKGIHMHSKAT